jgi:hypothetical protein
MDSVSEESPSNMEDEPYLFKRRPNIAGTARRVAGSVGRTSRRAASSAGRTARRAAGSAGRTGRRIVRRIG